MKELKQRIADWYVLRRDDVICFINDNSYALIKRYVEAVRKVESRQWNESLAGMKSRFDKIARRYQWT